MPSRSSLKKELASAHRMGAIVGDMAGRIVSDERTIRTALDAAKSGSAHSILFLSGIMMKLPATHLAEATTILCTVLDVPAFPPEDPLPLSLLSIREAALMSLSGLGRIPPTEPLDGPLPWHCILDKHGPAVWNWTQYFYQAATKGGTARPPWLSSPFTLTWLEILGIMPDIISTLAHCNEFKRLAIKDGDLLTLIVELWLKSDDKSSLPVSNIVYRYRCHELLHKIFMILDVNDSSVTRVADARELFIFKSGGNVAIVAKMLLGELRNPAKACKECFQLVGYVLDIIAYLVGDRAGEDETRDSLMDSLLDNDLVPLTVQLLSFVSEDLTNSCELRVLPEDKPQMMMTLGLHLLLRSIVSRNGPRWVFLLFKHGLLRALASTVAFFGNLSIENSTLVSNMLRIILLYLGHRFVVVSAIKAVKEITLSGDVTKLESDVGLRESWMTFANVLLERTVLNTVYDRDFTASYTKKCENCKKTKEEIPLFKCGGCSSVQYCSKECQKISWGGHRRKCKEIQEVLHDFGTGFVDVKFLDFVALTEIRRHMPGLTQLLAASQPSAIPLEDAFLTVMFLYHPPVIFARTGEDLPDLTYPKHNLSRTRFREFQENSRDRENSLPSAFESQTFPGGCSNWRISTLHPIPFHIRLSSFLPTGDVFAGDAPLPEHLMRKPALDGNGNELAFFLDEVDRFVMDARKHFRPPAPGDDETSPKTIYDYVEAKVTADPKAITWLSWE